MANLRAYTMPKWGIEMTEGVVADWMVKPGQTFKKGDTLALIETDKITNEVEAEYDGQFARILAATGQVYPVGALLAVVSGPDDKPADADVDAFIAAFAPAETKVAGRAAPAAASRVAPVAVPAGNISPAAAALAADKAVDTSTLAGSGPKGRITYQDVDQAGRPAVAVGSGKPVDITPVGNRLESAYASPLARRLAVQHGVDLGTVKGTGPRGRIAKGDVMAVVKPAAPPAPGTAEVVRMSAMRKAIARALTHSKTTIPHFYLRARVRMDALLALRAQAKAATGEAPSVNDYVVRACALALMQHRDVNVQVHGDEIHRFASADIAIAVATPKGLITPIIHGADQLTVAAIGARARALAEKARAGKLQPPDYQGGSFSISNLGMFGIDQFDAIINPPQGAILAVGAATRQPVEVDHALAFATIMEVSLSCDHRAIDGAVGAEFMRTLKGLLEAPAQLTA